jgi:hypothetical protein
MNGGRMIDEARGYKGSNRAARKVVGSKDWSRFGVMVARG